jgi:hypothetical protein
LRLLAEQGEPDAQHIIGLRYKFGHKCVPQNDIEAVKWLRLAADQGYAKAQVSLGSMYEQGRGVPKSDAEALKWYRLAADQGNAHAQKLLGRRFWPDMEDGGTEHDTPYSYDESVEEAERYAPPAATPRARIGGGPQKYSESDIAAMAGVARPSIWPVLIAPLVASVYYLALKSGVGKSLAIVGTLDASFEFDSEVEWGVHWFYRLAAEVGSVALGTFIAAGLARGRERIAGITGGLTIAIGFATFWLGFFAFAKLHDLSIDPRDYSVPEPLYQHAIDGLMIILAPFIGAQVSKIAQHINSRKLAGLVGINRLHFLWLWFAAHFYGAGLAVPIGRYLTRSEGFGVIDLLTGALVGLPAAAIPLIAFLVPGYYGLALLSGQKRTDLRAATRNLLGVLVLFGGLLVGGAFLIGSMLIPKLFSSLA